MTFTPPKLFVDRDSHINWNDISTGTIVIRGQPPAPLTPKQRRCDLVWFVLAVLVDLPFSLIMRVD